MNDVIVVDDEGQTHAVTSEELFLSPQTGRLYLYPQGPNKPPVFVWAVVDESDTEMEA